MSTRASRDDASMISATNIKLLHTIMMSARLKNYLAVLLYVSVFSLLAQGDGVNNGISWPAGGDAPAVGNGERRQYVFLFSNGHVGTTSLGNAEAYPVPDRPCSNTACFFYEQNNVFGFANGFIPYKTLANFSSQHHNSKKKKRMPPENSLTEWYNDAASDTDREMRENEIVRLFYLKSWSTGQWPGMASKKAHAPQCTSTGHVQTPSSSAVVVGHDILYYYRGILNVLPSEGLDVLFVRLRRSRYEIATSWLSHAKRKDGCFRGSYRYCPLEATDSIILKVPPEKWKRLSSFGKGLWYVDEVEARWQTDIIRSGHAVQRTVPFQNRCDANTSAPLARPTGAVTYAEINWSKYNQSSFSGVEHTMAQLLGLGKGKIRNVHERVHVKGNSYSQKSDDVKVREAKEEQEYQNVMAYSNETLAMLRKAYF